MKRKNTINGKRLKFGDWKQIKVNHEYEERMTGKRPLDVFRDNFFRSYVCCPKCKKRNRYSNDGYILCQCKLVFVQHKDLASKNANEWFLAELVY